MEQLNILWTSNDKDTFQKMVAMYAKNSINNGWWEAVNIIIWGGSTRLSAEDKDVQKELKKLISLGITVEACKACADSLKASATLKELGIEVKYMSKLTKLIKDKEHLLSV